MKLRMQIFTITLACIAVVLGIVPAGCASSHQHDAPAYALVPLFEIEDRDDPTALRIGTYDRKALIVAFYGSTLHDTIMRDLHQRHDAAVATSDLKDALRLEIQGESLQSYAHEQLAGSASLNNIRLALFDDLPEIAGRLKLDRIEQEGLPAVADAIYVDVTDVLLKKLPEKQELQ